MSTHVTYPMPGLGIFLTPSEKDHFTDWREVITDKSVSGRVTDPLLNWVVQFVPDNVAPNALTVGGSIAIMQAWYFCENYSDTDPLVVSAVSVVSIAAFWLLGALDGKHAARIMNDTSMGEFFKYACDLISSVFLVVVLCSLLMEKDLDTQWYCVQSLQLVFLLKHYSAFTREAGLRYILVGPGELISWAAGLLCIRIVLGIDMLSSFYSHTWGFCSSMAVAYLSLDPVGYLATMHPARAAYLTLQYFAVFRVLAKNPFRKGRAKHASTSRQLAMIMAVRGASAYFRWGIIQAHTTKRDVITDGLFMSLVTSDLILSKMAGRELHPWVTMVAMMIIMPHLQFLILAFTCFYYIAVFTDLSVHMNLPLLTVCRNVYCDGIYDLCHIGHKNLFREALKLGNRLFVGVVGDTDANAYKRPPVMSAAEREAEVGNCKCVTKVIPNAPCFGLTEEFIRQHRIHRVAFGQEYLERFPNPDDDPYYKVPRKMGIAIPMPRTEGFSTSELIARIQSRGKDVKKSPT